MHQSMTGDDARLTSLISRSRRAIGTLALSAVVAVGCSGGSSATGTKTAVTTSPSRQTQPSAATTTEPTSGSSVDVSDSAVPDTDELTTSAEPDPDEPESDEAGSAALTVPSSIPAPVADLTPTAPGPVFESSVRSADVDSIDYITSDDPSTFLCSEYAGVQRQEMLVPSQAEEGAEEVAMIDTHVVDMYFTDGTEVQLIMAPEVGDEAAAKAMAANFEGPLGALPTTMRLGVPAIKVYGHDSGPSSEPDGGWFSMGAQQVQDRLDDNDLHETVFHESVHMSLDAVYVGSQAWTAAQAADGQFLTEYAAEFPQREDLAESALFAYTLVQHPDRLGEAADVVVAVVPNRLAFLTTTVFPESTALTYEVGPAHDCASG